MIRYPGDYNPIVEYWNDIESGREIVSDKIYRTYKHIIWCMVHDDKHHFDPKRSNRILEFAENFCRHSKGKFGGKQVVLELWEKAMLAVIFGFIDNDGNRKYREAMLIIGKKNGKSLIASIVALYLQAADGEAGPEVYATATKKDQAKIIWEESKKMVNKSPDLKRIIKPLTHVLISAFNDGIFKPLASDSNTLDGLNIHGGMMDEIHQWRNGKALYDIIADGTSAREQPLIFITSTAGTVREDLYDMKYDEATNVINGYGDPEGYHDERFIAFIYELDTREEWTDEACWKKANPGLGTIKNLETLRHKVEKAKVDPNLVKNMVTKEFNIRETTDDAWLTFDAINNESKFDLAEMKPKYGVGGVDLSSTTDLTAAKVIFMVPGDEHIYVLSMYWLPADLIAKRAKEDKIPYETWVERGLMRSTPGNTVHPKYVTEWFQEVMNIHGVYLPWIGYDAWSAKYWVEEMGGIFGPAAMVPVIQGKKTLSGPMKELGADLESKLIVYNNNPIDKWCLTNTAIDVDKNDNIQPMKTSHQRKRIDGTAALLDAYVVLLDKKQDYLNMI